MNLFLNGDRYEFTSSNVSCLAKFSETRISQNPSKVILDEAHVALEPGIKFGKQSESYARLNFATSREFLKS